MKKFKNKIERLKKQENKKNKEDVLKNADALYNGLNIFISTFEKSIFEYGILNV